LPRLIYCRGRFVSGAGLLLGLVYDQGRFIVTADSSPGLIYSEEQGTLIKEEQGTLIKNVISAGDCNKPTGTVISPGSKARKPTTNRGYQQTLHHHHAPRRG
jgi:hypothetical protein